MDIKRSLFQHGNDGAAGSAFSAGPKNLAKQIMNLVNQDPHTTKHQTRHDGSSGRRNQQTRRRQDENDRYTQEDRHATKGGDIINNTRYQ